MVASAHTRSLIEASLQVLLYTVNLLAHLLLIGEYYVAGWRGAGTLLVCLYCLAALTHILFDYLNRGRVRYFLADLFHVRIFLEFANYIQTWKQRRGKRWINHRFRSAVGFESFFLDLPALTTQVFVLITTDRTLSDVQLLAFVTTCLSTLLWLLEYLRFIHVSGSTYAVLLSKAAVSLALRTALVALLVDYLRMLCIPCILASWLLGCAVYTLQLAYARRHGRDDPLVFWQCHAAVGSLMASLYLFVRWSSPLPSALSFSYPCSYPHIVHEGLMPNPIIVSFSIPFAPSHSVHDWWSGMLLSESKMHVENLAMGIAYIIGVYSGDQGLLFYSVCFFAASMMLFNLAALWMVHKSVMRQLAARGLYTNGRIVRLFAYMTAHLQRLLLTRSARTRTRTEGSTNGSGDGNGNVIGVGAGLEPADGAAVAVLDRGLLPDEAEHQQHRQPEHQHHGQLPRHPTLELVALN